MTRRAAPVLVAAALALAACTSGPPARSAPPVTSPSFSPTFPTPPTLAPSPGGPSPIPTLTGPPGTLLVRTEGTGPSTVTLAKAPRLGSRLTVRFTCVGAGTTKVSDHTGGLIEATGGCTRGVVYSSAWSSTGRDGKTITVTVLPGTRWAIDVWLGNPAITLTAPTSA